MQRITWDDYYRTPLIFFNPEGMVFVVNVSRIGSNVSFFERVKSLYDDHTKYVFTKCINDCIKNFYGNITSMVSKCYSNVFISNVSSVISNLLYIFLLGHVFFVSNGLENY
jgi:hypothetical protein